jgi:hypothetical protein
MKGEIMFINSISGFGSQPGFTQPQMQTEATTRQLAHRGDPVAFAKLRREEKEQDPALSARETEPVKGENADRYA